MTEHTEHIDLRGLKCPEPVIRVKRLFENKELNHILALVDDEICVANLSRLARSLKLSIDIKNHDNYFSISIFRPEMKLPHEHTNPNFLSPINTVMPDDIDTSIQAQMTVLFINKEQFGQGDEEFSKTLLNVFLQTMHSSGHKPKAILLANSGVKLLSPESQALKVLQEFQASGTEVLACGLCVDYYGLKENIAKEQITNMFVICEYLLAADKVISP